MALTSPAGPNEFYLKGLLTFYVTLGHILSKFTDFLSSPWHKAKFTLYLLHITGLHSINTK